MRGSLKIAKFFGIEVFVHWSFLLLLGFIVFSTKDQNEPVLAIVENLAFVLLLFVCVTLHEFGHALMARRFNIPTLNITLLPIGGIASLLDIPKKASHEFWVAIAGPLVNIAIAIGINIYFIQLLGVNETMVYYQSQLDLLAGKGSAAVTYFGNDFIFSLLEANIFLFLFNLIPAYPMDGGRVLKAILWGIFGFKKGTNTAAYIGQVLAVLFVGYGLFSGAYNLAIIGVFIFINAHSERKMLVNSYNENTKSFKEPEQQLKEMVPVAEFLETHYPVVYENENVTSALDAIKSNNDKVFLVINSVKQPVGIISKIKLDLAAISDQSFATIKELMEKVIPYISPEQPVKNAVKIMQDNDMDMLPVVFDNKLLGIVRENQIRSFMD